MSPSNEPSLKKLKNRFRVILSVSNYIYDSFIWDQNEDRSLAFTRIACSSNSIVRVVSIVILEFRYTNFFPVTCDEISYVRCILDTSGRR